MYSARIPYTGKYENLQAVKWGSGSPMLVIYIQRYQERPGHDGRDYPASAPESSPGSSSRLPCCSAELYTSWTSVCPILVDSRRSWKDRRRRRTSPAERSAHHWSLHPAPVGTPLTGPLANSFSSFILRWKFLTSVVYTHLSNDKLARL